MSKPSEPERVSKEASIYLGKHPNESGTKRLEQALSEPTVNGSPMNVSEDDADMFKPNLQQRPANCPKFTQGQVSHPDFPSAHEPE